MSRRVATNTAVVIIIVICYLLTACSSSRPTTRLRSTTKPEIEATATIPVYPTPTEDITPSEETPTLVQTATLASSTSAYQSQVAEIITEYKAAYSKFQDVHIQWTDDYSLLTDSTWRTKMDRSLIDLQSVSGKIFATVPPSDRYKQLDQSIKALGAELALVVANYKLAIKKNDPEPIKKVTVSMENILLDTKTISIVLEGLGFAIPTSTHPGGATALCADGSYSYSASHRGACSHRGGVALWLQP